MHADEAVDAYWQHYLLSRSTVRAERHAAEHFCWAYEWLDAVASGKLERDAPKINPINLMVTLAKRAPDELALAYLGAGPVENYLARPDADIEAIDRAASRDPSFRMALRCACFESSLSKPHAERLRRFGPPL
jgi:hypothetical protein